MLLRVLILANSHNGHHAVPQLPLPLGGTGSSHKQWERRGLDSRDVREQHSGCTEGCCEEREVQPVDSADMAECCHLQGLDAGRESVMTRGLRARTKAAIHSSFCLFGKRKGVCGLSLGKQSRDSVEKDRLLGWASPSSHATCLCVSGD